MIKFIHAADIHLDSPLRGLAEKEQLPAKLIQGATRKALSRLVSLAIEEKVDLVLLAGDLYDRNWDDSATGFYFISEMKKLERCSIQVVMITGNHDALTIIKKPLPYPGNVKILSSKHAESFTLKRDEKTLAVVHGQSFQDKAEKRNLVANYPSPVDGTINIGILHTSLEGSKEHDTYAPVGIEELVSKGYDYWALGHIHKREIVREKPWIVYPGNIQGRNIRETGAKGCYLIQVDGRGAMKLDFRELDEFRWIALDISLDSIEDHQGFEERISDAITENGLSGCMVPTGIRITFRGQTQFHGHLAANENWILDTTQAILTNKGNDNLFIEKILVETRAPSKTVSHDCAIPEDALNIIHKIIESLRTNPDQLLELLKDSKLESLRKKIPGAWQDKSDADSIRPMDADWLAPLLDQVGPIIESLDRKARMES